MTFDDPLIGPHGRVWLKASVKKARERANKLIWELEKRELMAGVNDEEARLLAFARSVLEATDGLKY